MKVKKKNLVIDGKRVFICKDGFKTNGSICGLGCMSVCDDGYIPVQSECFLFPGRYKPNFHAYLYGETDTDRLFINGVMMKLNEYDVYRCSQCLNEIPCWSMTGNDFSKPKHCLYYEGKTPVWEMQRGNEDGK